MLKLSRRVEYGLIAVRHIALQHGGVCAAREIAQQNGIPYDLLSKVLQSLTRAGIIVSQQGMRGGYQLAHRPENISVSAVIRAIEGTETALMPCAEGTDLCELEKLCNIKSPLQLIQAKIEHVFSTMTVAEIA
jgi:Rrf2 family protein